MKKFAVILSGCGHRDGAEITEAVSCLVALSESGSEYDVFAPEVSVSTINHVNGLKTDETRVAIAESARISRGKVKPLKELKADAFDGLVLPGGFGAATVLSRFAEQGSRCDVLPDVERILNEFYKQEKPIAAICIAPAVIARVLGRHGLTVTLGADGEAAAEVRKTGAIHEVCAVEDYITDREHRVITSPAYMYDDAKPHQVFTGIRGAIKELVEMA